MKIVDLKRGTLFFYQDELYIKIDQFYDDYDSIVAVNIATGDHLFTASHFIYEAVADGVISDQDKQTWLEAIIG